MKESHLRSLVKAVSWRVFATCITTVISYLVTHKVDFALYIGLFEFSTKIIFFYIHERLWETISFGIPITRKVNKAYPGSAVSGS
jgi:uncharacterized membrane protein